MGWTCAQLFKETGKFEATARAAYDDSLNQARLVAKAAEEYEKKPNAIGARLDFGKVVSALKTSAEALEASCRGWEAVLDIHWKKMQRAENESANDFDIKELKKNCPTVRTYLADSYDLLKLLRGAALWYENGIKLISSAGIPVK